jgi:hypothetical protein
MLPPLLYQLHSPLIKHQQVGEKHHYLQLLLLLLHQSPSLPLVLVPLLCQLQ